MLKKLDDLICELPLRGMRSPDKRLCIRVEQANKWEQKFTVRHVRLSTLIGHSKGKKFTKSNMIYTSFNKGFHDAHISNITSVIIVAWISEMFQGQIKRCTKTPLKFHLIKLSYRNSKFETFRVSAYKFNQDFQCSFWI